MKSELLDEVEEFAIMLLKYCISESLYFHNLEHTLEVVAATLEISPHSELSQTEQEILTMAAWFHDLGCSSTYKGHEIESANTAFIFSSIVGLHKSRTDQIVSCILATRMPQKPSSELEKIICDADFYHFSRTDYPAHEQALRKEWEANLNLRYTDEQWNKMNYHMLREHQYWTIYGKTVL